MTEEQTRKIKDRRIKSRLTSVFHFVFWTFVLLSLRLFEVQVVEAGRFQKLALSEHEEKVFIHSVRGNIYDRNGELLAMSETGYSIAAVPSRIQNKEKTAQDLARILRVSDRSMEDSLSSSLPFIWIERKISADKMEAVKSLNLDGIEVVEEPTGKRVYPRGDLAGHILGYTGIDEQGLDGVELYYNKELKGSPGYFLASIDGLGRVMPDGISKMVPAIRGADLTLTIDQSLQYIAQTQLAACVKSRHAKSGSIVIMNPDNGEILALASYPPINGNSYYDFPGFALRDHAISDDYEPGSTFKLILAAAALDSGKITMDEKFLSSPSIQVGGWTIHNADDGLIPMSPLADIETIIQDSLNVGAASVALKIGTPTFWEMIHRFGLDRETGIDLPGEASSIIPDPRSWEPAQLATISYGQGIAVTPIQMAVAYAEIANGGRLIRPHLLKSIRYSSGETFSEPDRVSQSTILQSSTDDELKFLLSRVVEKGTGTAAAIPPYTTAGKTGTAQVNENGRYLSGQYVASFIGFAPVEKPAFVMLVNINQPRFPYWGGTVSAPVFKQIGSELLWRMQVPPSKGMVRVGPFEVWGEKEPNKTERKLE